MCVRKKYRERNQHRSTGKFISKVSEDRLFNSGFKSRQNFGH